MSETKSGKSREEKMDLCSLFDFFYNRRIIPSTPRGGNLDVGGEVDDGIKTPKLPIRGLRIVKKP